MNAERLAEIREKYKSAPAIRAMSHAGIRIDVIELLDHIAQLEAQRGGAVVVAVAAKDMLSGDIESCLRYHKDEPSMLDTVETSVAVSDWWFANIRVHQVPSDRVLKDGQKAVDAEYLTDLEDSVLQLMGERLEIEWDLSPMPGRIKDARALRSQAGVEG